MTKEMAPITPAQLDSIRQFDTCRIANAIEEFDVRLRNEGFTRPGLRCMYPHRPPLLGYAVTSRIRCSNPPPTSTHFPDRTDWWALMESFPIPRIAVVEDVDPEPGLGAFAGEVHATILKALGCVGLVTNGSVRDLPAVEALDFGFFASSVSVSHAYAHMVDFGNPIIVFGLEIRPGDLLYGDCHGVISIPLEIAGRVAEVAARQCRKDREIVDLCRSDKFCLSRLRDVVTDVR